MLKKIYSKQRIVNPAGNTLENSRAKSILKAVGFSGRRQMAKNITMLGSLLFLCSCILPSPHEALLSTLDYNVYKGPNTSASPEFYKYIDMHPRECEKLLYSPYQRSLSLWSRYNRYDCGIHLLKEDATSVHYELTWRGTCRYAIVVDKASKHFTSWYFTNENEDCTEVNY